MITLVIIAGKNTMERSGEMYTIIITTIAFITINGKRGENLCWVLLE